MTWTYDERYEHVMEQWMMDNPPCSECAHYADDPFRYGKGTCCRYGVTVRGDYRTDEGCFHARD